VVSVGPLFAEQEPADVQYSVVVIVPNKTGKDYAPYYLILDIAPDPFVARVYRTALVFALEQFFGRVQIFGSELTLAKYVQKEWPSEGAESKRWPNWCSIAGLTIRIALNQSIPIRMGAIPTNTPHVCARGLATRGINSTARRFVTGGTNPGWFRSR
jgi:hypothetical protein